MWHDGKNREVGETVNIEDEAVAHKLLEKGVVSESAARSTSDEPVDRSTPAPTRDPAAQEATAQPDPKGAEGSGDSGTDLGQPPSEQEVGDLLDQVEGLGEKK